MKISTNKSITISNADLEQLLKSIFKKHFDNDCEIKIIPKLGQQSVCSFRDEGSYTVFTGIEISGTVTEEV